MERRRGRTVKAAETLGQTRDQEKFARFIDFFVKMQQYAGHTITPETVQKFAQQMKLSGAVVSDEFIEHMMFLLAQETSRRGGDPLRRQPERILRTNCAARTPANSNGWDSSKTRMCSTERRGM